MKVLIIARGYPTEEYPTNGIFEFDQAKALLERGHDIIYLAMDLRSIRRKRKLGIRKLVVEGINIYSVNIPLGAVGTKWLDFVRSIIGNIVFKKIVNEYGFPDIIHAHFIGCGIVANEIFKKTNIPFVYTEHSSKMNTKVIPAKLLNRAINVYKNAGCCIAVSSHFCKRLTSETGVEFKCIHNIVDTASFGNVSNCSYSPNEVFTFVSVGTLSYRKGHDLVIEALSLLPKEIKTQLLIIGEGVQKSKLKQLIVSKGLENHVLLLGRKSRLEIAKIYQNTQAFVLASREEPFGVAYIEAMAVGIPVIGTKCDGPEDFINDNVGVLVNRESVDELSSAMHQIILNYNDYDPVYISKYSRDNFSPVVIANRLSDIYSKLVTEG